VRRLYGTPLLPLWLGVMSASPGCTATPPTFGSLFFERVLLPHRSLPARGFHFLMLTLGLISLAAGIGFVSIGAWPVTGFFGLDVILVYFAFRLNYRSARRSETIRLAGDAFTVERVSVRGERRMWQFQPFWLRVILEERGDKWNRLLVASHGRSLVIGDILTPAARRELAASIREALRRWRDSLNPAGAARH
jgi:uncharacterized membrane protein